MAVRSALRAGRPLTPGIFLSLTQGHSAAETVRSLEKSNDLIWNRTPDLPACSIVRQLTTLRMPHAGFFDREDGGDSFLRNVD
jgi:hypothetical protein